VKKVILIKLRSSVFFKTPPLGIGYLLKALEEVEDVKPEFIDCQLLDLCPDRLIDRLRQFRRPLLIGFQVFSEHFPQLAYLAPRLRRIFPETVLIAGGPHPSGAPEQTLRNVPDLDYLVKGEGEETLKALVRFLPGEIDRAKLDGIPNLVYREGEDLKFTFRRMVDVERYRAPAWEKLHPENYPPVQHGTFHKSRKVVPIITSRGCPYPCTYCAGHLLTGKRIRRRRPDDIVDEIEFLQARYGFEEFIVEDENFTFYREHVREVVDELERRSLRCYFSFPNGIRIDRIDSEIVDDLRRMGAYMVTVGLESGSRRTLRAMKKNLDPEQVRKGIRLLKEAGIIVSGAFILGFSSETMEDVEATIRFAIDSGIDQAYFGNYMPLPGSEDFNRLIDTGELKMEEIDWESYTSYYGKIPYHPPGLSQKELLQTIRRATLRFYLRPKIIWGFLKRVKHPVFIRNIFFRFKSLFLR